MKEMKKKIAEEFDKGNVPKALGLMQELINKLIENGEHEEAGKYMVLRKEIENDSEIMGLREDGDTQDVWYAG